MYRILVEEIYKEERGGIARNVLRNLRRQQPLAAENCRISALSSADYCLRGRREIDWGRIAWRGNKTEIARLFEAERLNSADLEKLEENREYTVLFFRPQAAGCA